MYRDFSENSKRKLLSLVSSVENEKICDFTDWIGDRWLDFQSWIGKLSIKKYINNIRQNMHKMLYFYIIANYFLTIFCRIVKLHNSYCCILCNMTRKTLLVYIISILSQIQG